jgi:hypothetical protein
VYPGTNKQIIILVPGVSYRVGKGIHTTGYSLNTKGTNIIICLLVPGYTEHFVLFHLRQQLISP